MSDVAVVTVYTPRPEHPKWRDDYVDSIGIQRLSAMKFGHQHIVVTDTPLPDFAVLHTPLPKPLMQAIVTGHLRYLEQWDNAAHVLLADTDALICRNLGEVFDGSFDIGVTWRPVPPLNNGVIYVRAGTKDKVLPFFRSILAQTKDHWGGDQEALSLVVAPIPKKDGGIEERCGCRVAFLSMRIFNCIPEEEGRSHFSNPFVIHFKGETRKPWMRTHYKKFLSDSPARPEDAEPTVPE